MSNTMSKKGIGKIVNILVKRCFPLKPACMQNAAGEIRRGLTAAEYFVSYQVALISALTFHTFLHGG